MPVVKISLDLTSMHLIPQQYGALVAWVMKCPSFHEISVKNNAVEISFISGINGGGVGQISVDIQKIYAEISAFSKLDPFPCPCGCGAFIALDPCFRQSEKILSNELSNELTAEENEMVRTNQKIQAIKSVRQRTGLGLRDAKDIVDRAGVVPLHLVLPQF